jgi:hypothetical protein
VIASRYLPATAVLLALTLVPTIVHTYVGVKASDGKTSAIVARELHGVEGADTGRSALWVKENFGTEDFIERRYGGDVTLFVARAYDAKRLYHHPELGLAYGRRFEAPYIVRATTSHGPVPVHMLSGEDVVACYALLYDREFVESPLRFEAAHILETLAAPASEMTLFFARGPASATPHESSAVPILLGAIDSFMSQPPAVGR